MDKLPQELIDHIASFLAPPCHVPIDDYKSWSPPYWTKRAMLLLPSEDIDPESKISQLATISTAWRSQLSASSSTAKPTRRHSQLNELTYVIELPKARNNVPGDVAERLQDGEEATKGVEKLFRLLKAWDNDMIAEGGMTLIVSTKEAKVEEDPADIDASDVDAADIDPAKPEDSCRLNFYPSQGVYLQVNNLPVLRQVHTFYIDSANEQILEMGAVAHISAKLPNLTELNVQIFYNDLEYWAQRRNGRHEFAKVFSNLVFPALTEAHLDFCTDAAKNHSKRRPNLLDEYPWSQHLKNLQLKGVFDFSLFWPHEQSPAVTFPNLELLEVVFDLTSPSGPWYFIGVNGNDEFEEIDDYTLEQEELQFRKIVHSSRLTPLVHGFAQRSTQLPSLHTAILTTGPVSSRGCLFEFEICYFAPGESAAHCKEDVDHKGEGYESSDEQPSDKENRRLYMCTSKFGMGDWRPNSKTMGVFKEAGRSKWGGGLIIKEFCRSPFLYGRYMD